MLQKGFLKPKGNPENTRAVKRGRLFFIVGVIVILSALVFMMFLLRPDESFTSQFSSVKMAGIVMIAGIILVFVGFWMNFFAQNKNRQQVK